MTSVSGFYRGKCRQNGLLWVRNAAPPKVKVATRAAEFPTKGGLSIGREGHTMDRIFTRNLRIRFEKNCPPPSTAPYNIWHQKNIEYVFFFLGHTLYRMAWRCHRPG